MIKVMAAIFFVDTHLHHPNPVEMDTQDNRHNFVAPVK